MATTIGDPTKDFNGNAITPGNLAPVDPLQTVPAKADTTNYSGITGGVTQSIIDEYKNLSSTLATKEANQANEGTAIIDAMKKLTGKTADQQQANKDAGVDTETENIRKLTAQLADLNGQATSLNREAQAIPIQTQENNRNTGATDRGVAPQDAGALRLNALKALSIGQQADVASAQLTGSQLRLQSAKDKAQQIVDLKYKPLEDDLAIRKEQYDLNKDVLASLDKKRTEALSVALKKEEQDLADKKDFDKYVADMTTTALASGAPAGLIASAGKAKTKLEVAQILGKYSPDTLKYELLKEQIKTEKAQQSNIYANIAKTKAETSQLGQPGGGKPPTQDQVLSAGFADRIQQANTVIDANASTFAKMNYAQFKMIESKNQLSNSLLTPQQRQVAQAMRNFITAKLRKESGASISPSEFDDARLQYFPALGDDATTLAQKKTLRDSVLNNLITGSGSAYKPTAPAVDNPFSQALGSTPNQSFAGTSILSGTNKDGTLNFSIPK